MGKEVRKPGPNRIILALDSHALAYFQSCHKKYWLGHIEHLHAIKNTLEWDKDKRAFLVSSKFNAFELGTFIHDITFRMNRLRLRALKNKVPFKIEVTDQVILSVGLKRISRCKNFDAEAKMFHTVKLIQYYSILKEQYAFLKPLGAEVGFSKVLYEDNDVCFLYEGRIDYIAKNEPEGSISWIDYKTQSKEYVLYENPNQFLGYSWTLGTNVGYVQYYGLQAGSKNAGAAEMEREKRKFFRLEPIYHAPQLIEQWKSETIQTFREVASLIPFGELAFRRNRAACTSGFSGVCHFARICDNAWAPEPVLSGIKRTFYRKEEWHPWRVKEVTE